MPKGDVSFGDGCEVGVELDAFHAEEGELGGEEQGAAFAGAYVEEDGLFDGLGSGALEPDVQQTMEDRGSHTVVGGEFGNLGTGAFGDDVAGDEAGGVGVVELVEGVDGGFCLASGHEISLVSGMT